MGGTLFVGGHEIGGPPSLSRRLGEGGTCYGRMTREKSSSLFRHLSMCALLVCVASLIGVSESLNLEHGLRVSATSASTSSILASSRTGTQLTASDQALIDAANGQGEDEGENYTNGEDDSNNDDDSQDTTSADEGGEDAVDEGDEVEEEGARRREAGANNGTPPVNANNTPATTPAVTATTNNDTPANANTTPSTVTSTTTPKPPTTAPTNANNNNTPATGTTHTPATTTPTDAHNNNTPATTRKVPSASTTNANNDNKSTNTNPTSTTATVGNEAAASTSTPVPSTSTPAPSTSSAPTTNAPTTSNSSGKAPATTASKANTPAASTIASNHNTAPSNSTKTPDTGATAAPGNNKTPASDANRPSTASSAASNQTETATTASRGSGSGQVMKKLSQTGTVSATTPSSTTSTAGNTTAPANAGTVQKIVAGGFKTPAQSAADLAGKKKEGRDCDVCAKLMGDVGELVSNKDTNKLVANAFHELCSIIPKEHSVQCKEGWTNYGSQLLVAILEHQKQVAAKLFPCYQAKLCPRPAGSNSASDGFNMTVKPVSTPSDGGCNACGLAVSAFKLYMERENVVTTLRDHALKHCDEVEPSSAKDCRDIMANHIGLVADAMKGAEHKDQFCSDIGYCEPKFSSAHAGAGADSSPTRAPQLHRESPTTSSFTWALGGTNTFARNNNGGVVGGDAVQDAGGPLDQVRRKHVLFTPPCQDDLEGQRVLARTTRQNLADPENAEDDPDFIAAMHMPAPRNVQSVLRSPAADTTP